MIGFLIGAGAVSLVALPVYAYAIFPRRSKKFDLPVNTGYAHRGFWDESAPENSMAAFRRAIDRGFGIECDVHLTSDKIPVVFHDDTLLRMCQDNRKIEECTFDELSALRLLGTDEKIPRFSELLECVDGKVPLLVELKGESATNTELCDVIAPMLDAYRGELVVESFNPILLGRMKKIRPDIIRGQLVTALNRRGYSGSRVRNFVLSALLTNCISRPDFIAYDLEYPNSVSLFVATRMFGAKRCVWTARNIEQYRKFISKGDCPIFDSFDPKGENENA